METGDEIAIFYNAKKSVVAFACLTLIVLLCVFSDINANVSLHWNIVPYVGFMTYGHSKASEGYAFPLPSGIQT